MKQIILNTKEPLLIEHQVKCKLISWSLQDWKNELDAKLLKFRCGSNEYTDVSLACCVVSVLILLYLLSSKGPN